MNEACTCCGRPVCVAGGAAGSAGAVVVLVEPTSAGCGAGGALVRGGNAPGPAAAPVTAAAVAPAPAPPVMLAPFFLPPPLLPFDGSSISFSSLSICAI